MTDKTKDQKDAPAPKEAPKKTQQRARPTDPAKSLAAANLAKAMNAITKATGLKPFDSPDTTLPHVPTGSTNLDMLIGGTLARDGKSALCPGFPRRRITEVYGAESSGKTTLALSSAAQLQRKGGSVLFVDFEHHISKKYAIDIGIEWPQDTPEDTFKVIQPKTLEEGLRSIYMAILGGVDLVVVDSVAAMVPKDEYEKRFEDPAKIGAVAAAFSRYLPRIGIWLDEYPHIQGEKKKDQAAPGTALVLLNQVRSLISTGGGGGHGDGENTSGGKAMKFYTTLRLRLSRIKSESVKRKDRMTGKETTQAFGNVTHVKIVKSKLDGKQGHGTQIFIRYGYGIDDYISIIDAGVTNRLIKKEGSWYVLNNERFQGRDKLRRSLMDNPKLFEELKSKLLSQIIAGNAPISPDEELEDDDFVATAAKEFGDDEDEEEGMGDIPTETIEEDADDAAE